jgi:polysaccharide export outer membrane protein
MVLGLVLGSPLVSWGQPQNPQVPAPTAPEAQNPAPLNPAPQNPSAQNPQPITPPKPQQGAVPTAGGAPVDSGTYKVGPADVLLIRVWDEPAFTGPVAVNEGGKITLPLVGQVAAAGKTPLEIQAELTDALKKFVVRPLVTVTVQEVGSKRYYMDGLIARPGEYALVVPTTILEAISRAGGPQDFANVKKIYILRGDKRIYFNYKDVMRGKHMEQNIKLEPGDHIVLPGGF